MARRALALLARPVEPAAEAVVSAAQPPAVRTTPVAEPAADFAVGELSARPERRQREPRLALVWPMLRSQKHPSDHRIPRAWRSAAEEPPAAERLVRPAADEGVTPVAEGLLGPAADAGVLRPGGGACPVMRTRRTRTTTTRRTTTRRTRRRTEEELERLGPAASGCLGLLGPAP